MALLVLLHLRYINLNFSKSLSVETHLIVIQVQDNASQTIIPMEQIAPIQIYVLSMMSVFREIVRELQSNVIILQISVTLQQEYVNQVQVLETWKKTQ